MLYTISQVKEFLKGFPKYDITYSESSPKSFLLKRRELKLPISKENLEKAYTEVYKIKRKREK